MIHLIRRSVASARRNWLRAGLIDQAHQANVAYLHGRMTRTDWLATTGRINDVLAASTRETRQW